MIRILLEHVSEHGDRLVVVPGEFVGVGQVLAPLGDLRFEFPCFGQINDAFGQSFLLAEQNSYISIIERHIRLEFDCPLEVNERLFNMALLQQILAHDLVDHVVLDRFPFLRRLGETRSGLCKNIVEIARIGQDAGQPGTESAFGRILLNGDHDALLRLLELSFSVVEICQLHVHGLQRFLSHGIAVRRGLLFHDHEVFDRVLVLPGALEQPGESVAHIGTIGFCFHEIAQKGDHIIGLVELNHDGDECLKRFGKIRVGLDHFEEGVGRPFELAGGEEKLPE